MRSYCNNDCWRTPFFSGRYIILKHFTYCCCFRLLASLTYYVFRLMLFYNYKHKQYLILLAHTTILYKLLLIIKTYKLFVENIKLIMWGGRACKSLQISFKTSYQIRHSFPFPRWFLFDIFFLAQRPSKPQILINCRLSKMELKYSEPNHLKGNIHILLKYKIFI